MTVILDKLNIETVNGILKDAGENATLKQYVESGYKIGNEPYYKADQRLNSEKIEKPFFPLDKGKEIATARRSPVIEVLHRDIPEFRQSFAALEQYFEGQYKNSNILDILHYASHISIPHTPKGEMLTSISERTLYKSDVLTHLICNTYLSVPPLSHYVKSGQIIGLKSDQIDINKLYSSLQSTAFFYMHQSGYVNQVYRDNSFREPIVENSTSTSPVQITIGEVLEAAVAAKIVNNKVQEFTKKPLSEIELLEVPKLPAKLFTMNDQDREVIQAAVYPERAGSTQIENIKKNHKDVLSFVSKIKSDWDKFHGKA